MFWVIMAATNLIAQSKPVRISRVWVDRGSFLQLVCEGPNERTEGYPSNVGLLQGQKFLALSGSSIYNPKVEVGFP